MSETSEPNEYIFHNSNQEEDQINSLSKPTTVNLFSSDPQEKKSQDDQAIRDNQEQQILEDELEDRRLLIEERMKKLDLTDLDLMFFPVLAEKGNLTLHKSPNKNYFTLTHLYSSPSQNTNQKTSKSERKHNLRSEIGESANTRSTRKNKRNPSSLKTKEEYSMYYEQLAQLSSSKKAKQEEMLGSPLKPKKTLQTVREDGSTPLWMRPLPQGKPVKLKSKEEQLQEEEEERQKAIKSLRELKLQTTDVKEFNLSSSNKPKTEYKGFEEKEHEELQSLQQKRTFQKSEQRSQIGSQTPSTSQVKTSKIEVDPSVGKKRLEEKRKLDQEKKQAEQEKKRKQEQNKKEALEKDKKKKEEKLKKEKEIRKAKLEQEAERKKVQEQEKKDRLEKLQEQQKLQQEKDKQARLAKQQKQKEQALEKEKQDKIKLENEKAKQKAEKEEALKNKLQKQQQIKQEQEDQERKLKEIKQQNAAEQQTSPFSSPQPKRPPVKNIQVKESSPVTTQNTPKRRRIPSKDQSDRSNRSRDASYERKIPFPKDESHKKPKVQSQRKQIQQKMNNKLIDDFKPKYIESKPLPKDIDLDKSSDTLDKSMDFTGQSQSLNISQQNLATPHTPVEEKKVDIEENRLADDAELKRPNEFLQLREDYTELKPNQVYESMRRPPKSKFSNKVEFEMPYPIQAFESDDCQPLGFWQGAAKSYQIESETYLIFTKGLGIELSEEQVKKEEQIGKSMAMFMKRTANQPSKGFKKGVTEIFFDDDDEDDFFDPDEMDEIDDINAEPVEAQQEVISKMQSQDISMIKSQEKSFDPNQIDDESDSVFDPNEGQEGGDSMLIDDYDEDDEEIDEEPTAFGLKNSLAAKKSGQQL